MLIDYKVDFIDRANSKVTIESVLQIAGVELTGRSKVLCPWTMLHSDSKPAFKIFGNTNTGRCFSCQRSYSPVTLAAQVWECSFKDAAIRLLDTIDDAPKTLRERWAELEKEEDLPVVDVESLAEALRVYCSRISPDWHASRLSFAGNLNRCFQLLPAVKTEEDVMLWLAGSKEYMRKVIVEA